MPIRRSPFGFVSRALRSIPREVDHDTRLAMKAKAIHEKWTRSRKGPVEPFGSFTSNPNLEGRTLRNNLKSSTFEPTDNGKFV